MGTKERTLELFKEYLNLATLNQTEFRRKVMTQLQVEFKISLASSATYYNNAKKVAEAEKWCPSGLGREKPTITHHINNPATSIIGDVPPYIYTNQSTHRQVEIENDTEPCFTVIEVINGVVERTESFLDIGEARDIIYDHRMVSTHARWKLITGLGPNPGERYYLRNTRGEEEVE